MAKESFDKEIQFLRMFVLTGGTLSRQQFAERLGISVHTFDKTMRRLKEIAGSVHQHALEEPYGNLTDTLRYSYYDSSDPMLLFLFRAKSVKESESERISLLLGAMNERALEGIIQLEEAETVNEEFFEDKVRELMESLRFSWLIDTGPPVTVRARFYKPEGPEPDFIKERVLAQGQWGRIVEEDDRSFVYEIVVSGTTEIKPWLRSFGSSCEILEPLQLRREMIAEWKEILSYYESV